ncbi:16S rRNA (cytosine(1402)-N(4))-methyltransferase RsmH [Dietzia maris]|uniref:16S rRNA (cytosine(1402)-N(4))-methyltransferase RsmH n=1 Tax=Dietzia maris TaxID=37915 RepID=UPI0021AFFDE4|nr:16S rRNA (cytosine(1402)-N(4))-methyltransferase RsmH [Dietzia maris]MCT1433432.1 16S rRNA (cytosine(1402)-N(4))-methyltransferase RsmH [Dietzia maris]MCT1520249.1 16S rRNA (cytosine(1402)-N(4))-methyltransferase RsmH [Dietzia maris]
MADESDADRDATRSGHIPVFLERTIELFRPVVEAAAQDGRVPVIVDGTLGLGGHSSHLLAEFGELRILGVDRDPEALEMATRRLTAYRDRFTPVHARFDDFDRVVAALPGESRDEAGPAIDGILLDFGVSSMQLDVAERGFAYSVDSPLDMRMDPTTGPTAADILADYPRDDLARVLRVYGEERFARQIAAAIVRRRDTDPVVTSSQLVELLYDTIPQGARRTGGHPGKRVFQALRIEVNAELEAVENAVPGYLDLLRLGGRAVFMSYHSLEDKIVKRELATRTASRTPAGLPVELPGHGPEFEAITRGAEKASQEEIDHNPRSASVRVRCVRRIDGRTP